MAVNVPNPGLYLGNLSSHITALRNAYQTVLNDNAYIAAMGGATFLEAASPNGLALASGDASAIVAALGNLAASNLGTALTDSETLWGGM
jgi:hypothetical protein